MSTPAELLRALGREARAGGRNGTHAQDDAVRVYRGRSVDDIIPQIQRELGADAIIVRRRDGLAGGVLGFFQHPYVEIEAMRGVEGIDLYDEGEPVGPPELIPPAPPEPPSAPSQPTRAFRESPQAPSPAPPPPVQQPAPAPVPGAPAPGSSYVSGQLAALARARASAPQPPRPPEPPPVFEERPAPVFEEPPMTAAFQEPPAPEFEGRPAPAPAPRQDEPFAAGVDFHELIVREEPVYYEEAAGAYAEYVPPRPRSAPVRTPRRTPSGARADERRAVAPGSQGRARVGVERGLRRVGISSELARELVEGAAAHVLPLAPRAGLAQAVRTTLAQRIPVARPLPTRGAAIVVVGAGGAGKTTCCAALLTAYRNGSTLPASFATLTRGAERSDLRLILAPRIVKPIAAGTPRALGALRRSKDEGLTVVDTPRLSPADKAGVRALAQLLGELKPERIVVALPATLGAEAAAQLLTALRPLGANALAVTHVDETDQLGVAVEAACRFHLAPEYLLDSAAAGGWRLRRVDPVELAGKLLP
jgi:SRP54-type protein, GTPase domain